MNTSPLADKPLRLEVSRHFTAAPERVFDAWLDPASACHWLFATPDGVMQRVEIDPRVGGRFRIDERRGAELARHFGEYLEIERPRRLVFTFSTEEDETPSRVTVSITPTQDGCELHLLHEMDPKWASYERQVREGWTHILEGLASTLSTA